MDPVLFAHSQDSGKCLVRGPIGNTPVRQGLGVDLTLTWGRHPPKHRALPPGPAPAGAQMAELVDALVSGTSAARRGGSSPLLGTIFSFLGVVNRSCILASSYRRMRYVFEHLG